MKIISLFTLLICFSCREYYEPPALKNNPNLLVVDGFLNGGPDSTYIKLSHTRSLKDTDSSRPELNAEILVEGDQNTLVYLTETGNGFYGNLLPLKISEKYRIHITTTDGKQYRSDFIPYKKTPPIDSLAWNQDSLSVNFYLNTHDPKNNTLYYRWQFEEAWQYTTYLTSNFDYVNGLVLRRLPEDQIHSCWKSSRSPSILLGSSDKLSKDIISRFLFNKVSKTTEKIYVKYSVLLYQWALTEDQFEYWSELKKSSEQLGSLFDAQPGQLASNIHCITNPGEPVLGYLSASTVEKKRIFVDVNQMSNYNYEPYYLPCQKLGDVTTAFSPFDTSRAYEYLEMPNHLFTFWYDDGSYHIAQNFCIDCREHGGTNIKPPYWQ